MIVYFLKRMMKQTGYLVKVLLFLALTFYVVYFVSVRFHFIATDYLNYRQPNYENAKTNLAILEKGYDGAQSKDDMERQEFYKENYRGIITTYQAVQNQDYKAYVEAEIARSEVEAQLYEKKYLEIPPAYHFKNVKENNHHLLLNKTYYQQLVEKDVVSANEAFQTTASAGVLEATGYWWPGFLKFFNLTTLLLLVPILFSMGIISQDKERKEFFKATPYRNAAYLADLFKSSWLHSFGIQVGLLLIFVIALCFQFGLGDLSVDTLLNVYNTLSPTPILMWVLAYLLLLAVLDMVLIGLMQLGELLFSLVGGLFLSSAFLVTGPLLDALRIKVPAVDWLPFYYLDIARALNGTKSITHGGSFSLVKGLLSCFVFLVVVLVTIRYTARWKERRGSYV